MRWLRKHVAPAPAAAVPADSGQTRTQALDDSVARHGVARHPAGCLRSPRATAIHRAITTLRTGSLTLTARDKLTRRESVPGKLTVRDRTDSPRAVAVKVTY